MCIGLYTKFIESKSTSEDLYKIFGPYIAVLYPYINLCGVYTVFISAYFQLRKTYILLSQTVFKFPSNFDKMGFDSKKSNLKICKDESRRLFPDINIRKQARDNDPLPPKYANRTPRNKIEQKRTKLNFSIPTVQKHYLKNLYITIYMEIFSGFSSLITVHSNLLQ